MRDGWWNFQFASLVVLVAFKWCHSHALWTTTSRGTSSRSQFRRLEDARIPSRMAGHSSLSTRCNAPSLGGECKRPTSLRVTCLRRCEDDHPKETNSNKFLDDLNAYERYFEMTTEVKTFFASEPNLIPEETFMEADDHDDQTPLQPGETVKTVEQLQKTMSWIEAQLQETEKHVQQEILHARDQG